MIIVTLVSNGTQHKPSQCTKTAFLPLFPLSGDSVGDNFGSTGHTVAVFLPSRAQTQFNVFYNENKMIEHLSKPLGAGQHSKSLSDVD